MSSGDLITIKGSNLSFRARINRQAVAEIIGFIAQQKDTKYLKPATTVASKGSK